VQALAQEINQALPTGFMQTRSKHELLSFLDGTRGIGHGVFELDRLVAIGFLQTPTAESPNQGETFPKVLAQDWPLHAAFLTNTMVLPSARGKGYQRALIATRLQAAEQAGMRWVCTGVHVANTTSWRNLLAQGFAIVGCRVESGQTDRSVLGLSVSMDKTALRSDSSDPRWIEAGDWVAHHRALEAGYLGISMNDKDQVVYQRSI
jgi:GNAT superfamily N-acetyltransferase